MQANRAGRLAAWISLSGVCALGADVCNPADLVGPFAFQLSGTTTISGAPKPTASLGRIVFDGGGKLSGTSSAMFNGLLLANPVTGTYEARSNCAVTWTMQDDSGAFQHFGGTMSPDGTRVQFTQTDPGGAQRGIMQKVSGACTAADARRTYTFTILGKTIPMTAEGAGTAVTVGGTLAVDPNGGVELTMPRGTTTGTLSVDADCTVHLNLMLLAADGTATPAEMRGALVDGGKEILAIQTDPGAMVAARFTSASK